MKAIARFLHRLAEFIEGRETRRQRVRRRLYA